MNVKKSTLNDKKVISISVFNFYVFFFQQWLQVKIVQRAGKAMAIHVIFLSYQLRHSVKWAGKTLELTAEDMELT